MLDSLQDLLWKPVHHSLSLQCLQVSEGMKQQPNLGAGISPQLLIWEALPSSERCACHPTTSQLSSLGLVPQSRGTAKTVSGKNVRAWTRHARRLHFILAWQQSIGSCQCCGKKQGDKNCFFILINSHLHLPWVYQEKKLKRFRKQNSAEQNKTFLPLLGFTLQ